MKKCNLTTEEEQLTEREKKFLKLIVEKYIETATPVGSNLITSSKDVSCSSATVRNVMSKLEKKGYLIKNHTSSGRTPSTCGFKYYEQYLAKTTISNLIKKQLLELFQQRNQNIEDVLEDAVHIIAQSIKLPAVITTIKNDLIMRKIELIQLNESNALLLLVFNEGTVHKNEITFKNPEMINDVSICIDILNEQLSGLTLDEITKKIEKTSKFIQTKVKNYEFVMQQIVWKIFDTSFLKPKADIINSAEVLEQKEFQNIDKVKMLMSLLNNTSIWEQIAFQAQTNKETPKITFGSDLNAKNYNDVVIATTNISINKSTQKQISVLGPTRMKYGEVIALLDFIKKEIEQNGSQENS